MWVSFKTGPCVQCIRLFYFTLIISYAWLALWVAQNHQTDSCVFGTILHDVCAIFNKFIFIVRTFRGDVLCVMHIWIFSWIVSLPKERIVNSKSEWQMFKMLSLCSFFYSGVTGKHIPPHRSIPRVRKS